MGALKICMEREEAGAWCTGHSAGCKCCVVSCILVESRSLFGKPVSQLESGCWLQMLCS